MSFFDLSAPDIDRQQRSLGDWKGKVVLVVNTASECGNTPQYAGLEKLWQEYKSRGFAVLGFPSNDFGKQEPGSEEQIKEFCSLDRDGKGEMERRVSSTPSPSLIERSDESL